MLTGAEVDAIAGLLHLRDGSAFRLYGAAPSLAVLDANPVFGRT
jgi:pyrroloquinoline quinone biosynthesis protein B